MKVYQNINELNGRIRNAVVTIGSFDGVHAGHKAILLRLNSIAQELSGESTLITFWPHPRKVLYPEQTDLKLINSTEEKIELLSKTGLQNLIIVPFTVEFSQTSSSNFVRHFLVEKINSKVIVVGPNHHFGHNRAGDFSYLYGLGTELGFRVEEISMLDIENEIISSTKIRKALFEGNIQKANAYLDNQYFIKGCVGLHDEVIDKHNLELYKLQCTEPEKLLPPPGYYASRLVASGSSSKTVAIIRKISEIKTEIAFVPVEPLLQNNLPQHTPFSANLLFYKKIMFEKNYDSLTWPGQLSEAIETTNDMIF